MDISCFVHRLSSFSSLQVNGNTKIRVTRGYAPAAIALVPGVFDESLVLGLVADMKTLRHHVAQVVGMRSRAALQIGLCGCQSHDSNFLPSYKSLCKHCYAGPASEVQSIFR